VVVGIIGDTIWDNRHEGRNNDPPTYLPTCLCLSSSLVVVSNVGFRVISMSVHNLDFG
jgi:hypothetical protein